MPFIIALQDITTMEVDAIVNAANTELQMGGGVCGAIFDAAGAEQLQAACDRLAPIETGEAVITPGFNSSARFIIHAAGPVYAQWSQEQSEQYLRCAYTNALQRAVENNCESVAFPLISSGIYAYPKEEALHVATSTIEEFLKEHDLNVTLVVYERSAFSVRAELAQDVERYIEKHAIEDDSRPEDRLVHLDTSFSQKLFGWMDSKKMTDADVYKRANINRNLFFRIKNEQEYKPSKRTAMALAVALKLSLDETKDFLKSAGYVLSRSLKLDIIVAFFITEQNYHIFEINKILFAYDLPQLGQ